jgi:hypothetical protein
MERTRSYRARFHRAPKSIVSPAEIYAPKITQAYEANVRRRDMGRKLSIGMLSYGMALMTVVSGWTAEPVTAIGSVLVNPNAVHRKVVKLEGVAKNVVVHSGSELGTNQSLCGAEFELEDGSGTITVLHRTRCQVGVLRAVVVMGKMPCVVEGFMDAPPTMLRTPDGKDLGVRIITHRVTPVP